MRTQVNTLLHRLTRMTQPAAPKPRLGRTVAVTAATAAAPSRVPDFDLPPAGVRADQPPARGATARAESRSKPAAATMPREVPAGTSACAVGMVTQVVDDVLVIADGELRTTVRLQAVQLHTHDPQLRSLAERQLQLLLGREVVAAGYDGTSGIDIVARVTCGDEDVNYQLLLAGLGRYDASDARALSQRDRALYAQAEWQARAARQGMWRKVRR